LLPLLLTHMRKPLRLLAKQPTTPEKANRSRNRGHAVDPEKPPAAGTA